VLVGLLLLAAGLSHFLLDQGEITVVPPAATPGGQAGDAGGASSLPGPGAAGRDRGGVEQLDGLDDAVSGGIWDGGNLRLRVVETDSRRPLAGVRLSLYAGGASQPKGADLLGNPIGVPDAVSDVEGLAVVRVPPGVQLRLIAYGAA
jgi:hypothetical protein